MDMKNLIAQMDAIENKKILKEDATQVNFDSQVDEFIKGTAPEKIAAWMKHIKDFKDKGMYKAADDATQAMKKVHPDYKKHSAPTPEFRGGIARALMQDMGVDDQDVEEDGETQMPDIPRVPMQSGEGEPVVSSDGQPVMSGGPTEEPAAQGSAPIQSGPTYPNGDPYQWDKTFDRTTGAGEFGSEPQSQFAMPDDSEMGGTPATAAEVPGSTSDQGAGPAAELATIPPEKLKRFEELLARLEAGKTTPAVQPGKKPGGAAKPAAPSAGLNPKVPAASAGAASPAYDAQDQTNISSMPAAESIKLSDDQVLAMIRAIK